MSQHYTDIIKSITTRLAQDAGFNANQPRAENGQFGFVDNDLSKVSLPSTTSRANANKTKLFAALDEQQKFEDVIRLFETEAANIGAQLAWDGFARLAYARNIRSMANDMRTQVQFNKISWAKAAEQASHMRTVIMQVIRGRSSPIGRAIAEKLKPEGETFNKIIADKTIKLFGKEANFQALSSVQKDIVYGAIVESAGKARQEVMSAMHIASRAGKALVVFSIAASAYNIAVSDDKVNATKKEITITGAGIAGGVAGGALAGLACGPGAPVCVAAGAFVGGAMAALGVEWAW